jgi:hypothetical protein
LLSALDRIRASREPTNHPLRQMEVDVSSRTYSQSIHSFIPNENQQLLIQDAVRRMHQIKLLASEFFTMHVNRCLDEALPIPPVTQTWVRSLFMRASCIDKRSMIKGDKVMDASVDATVAELEQTRTYARPSRTGLTQLLSAEAILLVSNFNTNVATHYKKRVFKFVRWSFKVDWRLPYDEHLRRKLEMVQVTTDLCRHGEESLESPVEYHAWVEQYRIFFGLDILLASESLAFVLKKSPHLFLKSMRLMSRAFEGSGQKTLALVPLTTTLRPGFVGFDTRTIGEVLHVGKTQRANEKMRAQTVKRDAERLAGTYKTRAEKTKLKAEQKLAQEEAGKAAREALRVADAKLTNKERVAVRKRRREEADVSKIERRAKIVAKKSDDYHSKKEFYAGFAHIRVRAARGFVFSHSFRTDGVSVRLLFERPDVVLPKQLTSLPRRGLFAIDELKRLSKLSVDEMQIIGVDPGMIDLINCVDPERILEKQPIGSPPSNVVYTAARRKHETCSVLYAKTMALEKRDYPAVLEAEVAMSLCNKRSTDRTVLEGYFDARHAAMPALLDFYGAIEYRTRRWRSFQKEQRSVQSLIDRIESMRTKSTMVLAYGSGVRAISKLKTRGISPCINMGLRRRLSKHFLVADTPEPYTSKTCSACHGPCGPFVALETQRRAAMKANATTDAEKKKADRHTIRGLRRCQNAECGVILHRDRNGASNICTTLRRLYDGKSCLGKPTTSEVALGEALGKLEN